MSAPTVGETLAELPRTLEVIRASQLRGVRGWLYRRAGSPAGFCYGSVAVIADEVWDAGGWAFRRVARHEAVHHAQSRGWRLPFFALAYLLFPLPIGLSGRAFLELAAFRETLRCYQDEGANVFITADALAAKFRSRSYGFMGWLITTARWRKWLLAGIA